MDLLEDRGAVFNELRTHRRRLWRIWNKSEPLLYVIGMNPSIADENDNDPTVARCEKRARVLGYGGICMLNVMDVIETDSRKLDRMPAEHRCTHLNHAELEYAVESAARGKADVLCAWGKPGQKMGSIAWLATRAARRGVTLFCLKRNKDGSPVHPLYQPYSKEFEWFAGTDFRDAAQPLVAARL